jgi:hypothetical protein
MTKREGPLVRVTRDCYGCRYEHSESYAVQSDSGHIVYCTHPSHPERKRVGDTNWQTPAWCPFLKEEA